MKRIFLLFILTLLIIDLVAVNCYAIDNTKYEEYINQYDDNDFIGSNSFFEIIYKKYEINSTGGFSGNFSSVTRNYIIDISTDWIVPINRTSALVTLMRINMLIPNDNVVEYKWNDIPDNLDQIYIDYINYAKQLGITDGTSETTFGFDQYISFWQLKRFISNIENIKNISQYQIDFPINIITNTEGTNIEKLASPLIIEYFFSLPKNIQTRLSKNNWEYILVLDSIPNKDSNVIGLADLINRKMVLTTKSLFYSYTDFHEIIIHETAHAIDYESNIPLVYDINDNSIILDIEMPKLGKEYREYATVNTTEYFACAWYWMEFKGVNYFSENYPYTYNYFLKVINKIQ